jgi:hypothetical protein
MSKIDDLQSSFDQLNQVVRDFLGSQQTRIAELEAVRDALVADDSVEDSKLEGLISAVDGLRSDVDSAAGNVPTPEDPSPVEEEPVDEEPVEEEPVDPAAPEEEPTQ